MLIKNPQGIALEKFSTTYEAEYGEWLKPSLFGYSDMVEMLKGMDDIVDMKLIGSTDQMLLFSKAEKIKGNMYFFLEYCKQVFSVIGIHAA